MKLSIFIPVILSFSVMGCSATLKNPPITTEKVNLITPKITTGNDIFNMFGKPHYVKFDYDNHTKFWAYHIRKSNVGTKAIVGLLGAGTGVAIGNQIGKGNGKKAARIIGGIAGAVIASSAIPTEAHEQLLIVAIDTNTNLVVKKDYEETFINK